MQHRRVINKYRDLSGLAVVSRHTVFEPRSASPGYRSVDFQKLSKFIRANFRHERNIRWLKAEWRQDLASKRHAIDAFTAGLPWHCRVTVRAWTTSPKPLNYADVRRSLLRLMSGLFTPGQCSHLRDLIRDARNLVSLVDQKIELYNLDRPLRFEWTGPDLNTPASRPFRRGGYAY